MSIVKEYTAETKDSGVYINFGEHYKPFNKWNVVHHFNDVLKVLERAAKLACDDDMGCVESGLYRNAQEIKVRIRNHESGAHPFSPADSLGLSIESAALPFWVEASEDYSQYMEGGA